jgi:hypothetical protein
MNAAIPSIRKARAMRQTSPIPTIIPVDIVVTSIIVNPSLKSDDIQNGQDDMEAYAFLRRSWTDPVLKPIDEAGARCLKKQ